MTYTEKLPPLPEPYHGFYATPMYSPDQMRAYARAALAQPAASGEPADLIAGALYDLMGHLTSRDETLHLGATEWAAPAVDALVAFAQKRGLSLNNPAIETWYTQLATAQPAPAPVSGEPVAWMYMGIKADGTKHGPHLVWMPAYMDAMSASKGAKATPLYAAPQPAPARVPLTAQQLDKLIEAHVGGAELTDGAYSAMVLFAAAVERAYGINTPAKEAP